MESTIPGHLLVERTRPRRVQLRLYHEVSVVPADGQHFEYVNCRERTGLLGLG